jgi:hypothetical protein
MARARLQHFLQFVFSISSIWRVIQKLFWNFILSEYYPSALNWFTSCTVISPAIHGCDSGFDSHGNQWSFFMKSCTMQFYVFICNIKIFLLYNVPGKVPIFFWYKEDIMRVNCMQNVTKYYILLRNVANVLKFLFIFSRHWKYELAKLHNPKRKTTYKDEYKTADLPVEAKIVSGAMKG